MLKNRMMQEKIAIGIILLGGVVNIAFYPWLPNDIAFHFNSAGETDGYISKLAFIFVQPLISVAIYLYSKIVKKIIDARSIASSVFMFGVDIVLLIINLR